MYGIAGVCRCRREALELRARAQDRRGRAEHRGRAPAARSRRCLLLLEQQRQARKTADAFSHLMHSQYSSSSSYKPAGSNIRIIGCLAVLGGLAEAQGPRGGEYLGFCTLQCLPLA